ncbi:nuclear transport factor 2 family protein [Hymenobacter sp. BT770]|uniref:nuclear transport factor 2 family protein n=1 Tax=Hymenobacter sp. BT770 TaxID=2886942 RepID=UPI001D11D831|nr:nuclear transport factor 2 family protein [Hymenobacter sp. BT770]MCC3153561.1 nuclear transport factor 2 family protein [Hymenobacter sp. BT770]MDO3415797.1 nuclear transport factor 2 family protein [Hymenobacter sp. BT770]
MNEQQNIQRVQEGYDLFRKGDIQNLMKLYTEDIEFIIPGPAQDVPYAGIYRGQEQVQSFFAKLHEAIDFERFETVECIAQGEAVVALGYAKGKARTTGQTSEEEWAHVFRMRDGKVERFQVYTDTAAVAQAFQRRSQMAM